MSTDPEQNYFIDDLNKENIADLPGRKPFPVIFCNSGKTIPPNYISILMCKLKSVFLVFLCFLLLSSAYSQKSRLFETDKVLEFTLKSDLRRGVMKDRGDDPQYHKATVHYQADQEVFDIPLKIKARGGFRKNVANCKYPPLFLNFKKSATPKSSIFRGQDKMKLVTPCRVEEYVVNEYLVYKLYNLITPMSFRARLVKVIYQDTVKGKVSDPYFGILLEEKKQMTKRNLSKSVKIKKLSPLKTQKEEFLTMAVFQYMIGNTDWSVQYQQNIELLKNDSTSLPITVPYDFDHAGIVRAPYAKPAEELKMTSTLQRRYRGYCMTDMNDLAATFQTFNQLKEDFYKIYEENELLSDSYKKQTLKFLDKFYETINDPKEAKEAFCDKSGTANVIIKGLNND